MRRVKMRSVLLTLAAVLAFVACRRSTSVTMDDAGAPASRAAAIDSGSSGVTKADVRLVIDAWLSAQNTADFRAYESLYAPRFEGVRRSGTQTARLDRSRWMREREGMFKHTMEVKADDVVIATSHEGADVRLVQTWSSGAYRDEGPKHMVLARVAGNLKIAREEMVSSTVAPTRALDPARFAFVVHVPGPLLVLSTHPDDTWAAGAARMTTATSVSPAVTQRAVDDGKLPSNLATWSGRKVELFGKTGAVCEGTIAGFAMVGRVVPHFGTVARWTGTGDHAGEPKPPARDVADEAWALSAGTGESGRVLAGEVHVEHGDCSGALWGRMMRPDEAKPLLVEGRASDGATRALALAELRKTKGYAETQRSYEQEKGKGPPRWEDFEARVSTLVFSHPSGTIVTISIKSGAGCGNFGATLSAAWEQKGGTLTLVKDADDQELEPISAGDVDGDGSLDLVFSEGLLRAKAGKYTHWNKLTIPFLDCGC
jgi:hypothetical protein